MISTTTSIHTNSCKKSIQKTGFIWLFCIFMNLFSYSLAARPALVPTIPVDSIYPCMCFVYPDSSCTYSGPRPGITNFTFATINNNSGAHHEYDDYSCCKMATLTAGNTYPISITTSHSQGEYIKVWIDYGSNGEFDQAQEIVFSGFANHTLSGSITIPSTVTFNRKLRLRVTSSMKNDSLHPCIARCGETEDYAIVIPNIDVLKPVAGFTLTESTKACYKSIACKNTSTNATSYKWDPGSGLGTLDYQNISYQYNTPGTYTVTLAACNAYGCDTARKMVTLDSYLAPVPTGCELSIRGGGKYLSTFRFDSLLYNQDMEEAYNNFTCRQIHVNLGSTYTITGQGYQYPSLQVWIDFNNDGVFTIQECVNQQLSPAESPLSVLIAPTAVQNKPLRMRVMTNLGTWCYNACTADDWGTALEHVQVDDYTVIVHPPLTVTADFKATNTNGCTDSYVYFTNLSSHASNYLWDFGDGTTSTEFEPMHTYSSTGVYTIKLKAYNSGHADSITRANYITVLQSLPVPVITLSGKTLSTNAVASGYQWCNDIVEIPGATSSSYVPVQFGRYWLKIKNANGCETWSMHFDYGPMDIAFNLVKPFPNPACGKTYYMIDNLTKNATNFKVLWGDGSSTDNKPGEGAPLHEYKPGTYTVTLIACNVYNQCDTLTKPNIVTVHDTLSKPKVSLQLVGNEYELHAITKDPGVTYEWLRLGDMAFTADSVIKPALNDGKYSVRTKKYDCISSSSTEFPYFPLRVKFQEFNIGICGDTSYTTVFPNLSTNAVSYLWNFGDGTTSAEKDPFHTFSPGIYTVSLKACSDTVCETFTQKNCIRLDSKPFVPEITIPVAKEVIFCSGFSISVPMSTPYHADYSYKWYRNYVAIDTAIHSTYEAKESVYMQVQVTNDIGCVALTSGVSIVSDPSCVWPGDANNDEQVTNLDLINIGLYYSNTGHARSTVNNAYTAFYAEDWGIKFMGGDVKHADCNGDGIIDSNDTMAVQLNFNAQRVYTKTPVYDPKQVTLPTLYLHTSKNIYKAGEWVHASVMLGDAITPVDALYGIAFNINYDKTMVEEGTASLTYPANWLATPGNDALTISKTDVTNGTVFGAEVGIMHANKSGYGKIADLHLKLKSGIKEVKQLDFTLSSHAVEATADVVTFFAPPFSVQVTPVVTAIEESAKENNISIYPNPYVNATTISYTLDKKSDVQIELYNVVGQKLETLENTIQPAGTYNLDFKAKEKAYQDGVYLIKIVIDKKASVKRIVKMQ